MRCALSCVLLVGCIDFNTPAFIDSASSSTLPSIIATFPRDGEVNVETNASLTVVFSKAMQPGTVQLASEPPLFANLFWDQNDKRVTGFVVETLEFAKEYTVQISGTDSEGGALEPITVSFTTVAAPMATGEGTGLVVLSTTPANNAQNVVLRPVVSATFSKPMNVASITLNPSVTLGETTWSPDNTVLSFAVPATDLLPNQVYAMTVEGTSNDGETLAAADVTFTTLTPQDVTAPFVESRTPAPSATGVGLTSDIVIGFSEPMVSGTVSIDVTDLAGPTPVPCTVTVDAARKVFTCNPSSSFPANATLSVAVGAGAKDDHDNTITGTLVHQFTAGAAPDTTAPYVTGVTPATGSVGIPLASAQLVLNFSEGVSHTGFSVQNGAAQDITASGVVTWNQASTQLVWTPIATPSPGSEFFWALSAEMKDSSQNAIAPLSGYFRVIRNEKRTIYALSGITNEGHLGTNNLDFEAVAQAAYAGIDVGDWDTPEAEMRGFITFNLSEMISGLGIAPGALTSANIKKAVLKVYLASCRRNGVAYTGALSGLGLGQHIADSVFFNALNTADFYRSTDTLDPMCWFGVGASCRKLLYYDYFAPADCASGYKTIGARELIADAEITKLDAVNKVRYDWTNSAARSFKSQWRFRFFVGIDGDSPPKQDNLRWYGGGNGQSVRPKLEVDFDYP